MGSRLHDPGSSCDDFAPKTLEILHVAEDENVISLIVT